MEDSGWRKDYEAEEQARARRKREKYKAAKISGPLESLEEILNIDTTDIVNESFDPDTLDSRPDETKIMRRLQDGPMGVLPPRGPSAN